VSPAAALQAAMLDWVHRDPFDRMIAVTCFVEDLPLLSPDAVFDAVGVRRFWN
jgi:PIN domain nuclease of toxin-antitoxin system